ncbi:uncharacterized protein C7orf50 homolog [Stegodyphus dumicola]|uniref:uncharacterized protein C7orf50 homolog n=1 Tax=Stegodyphus dumicola TaxID=202533 RepID=UPI0015AD2169|nr:uncharacterized protein C7orf50 homolog [Stegodyphus dumicola]XP_035217225.1 uncharacterized protein C7orf50 homolog [Stegodyphus dumicola]XP_035217226.1 uncharacterized protein C7orf50 homolog [Stegodyphus dumicola]XP_035217228.1 uncharacterized protein C7orf50 homolog [Stegodyphus dumicola]
MKPKSKLHTSIKNLVLAKAAQACTRNNNTVQDLNLGEDNNINETVLRKATEADKERKREKARLKRQRKKEARAKSIKKDVSEAKKLALNYLHEWNTSRNTWSFKKKQQFWLLSNIFNINTISENDFEILLLYITDLKGGAKSRLNDIAENILKDYEEKSKNSMGEADFTVFERARRVLQVLI